MNSSKRLVLALSFLMLSAGLEKGWAATSGPPSPPRIPTGVYAVVPVEKALSDLAVTDLTSLYGNLLNNDAVAGLAIQIHWSTLNPHPPQKNPGDPYPFSWDRLKEAFDSVHTWNKNNPSKPAKTIQLLVTPGFFTPDWVMDNLSSCDNLYKGTTPLPSSDCGRVTFRDVIECGGNVGCNVSNDTTGNDCSTDSTKCYVLPLPWNKDYKNAWNDFLSALAAKYGSDSSLVSIAVAGPTAASAEMILPNDNDAAKPDAASPASFTSTGPDDMWLQLLVYKYLLTPLPGDPACASGNLECIFVVEWKDAINTYGSTFSGLTLVVTTGDGLPNMAVSQPAMAAPGFTSYCVRLDQDCAAETQVLSYFGTWTVGGHNGKATQSSGVEASKAGPIPSGKVGPMNLGIGGVKALAYTTMTAGMPSTVILGGGQFNTKFSDSDKDASHISNMEREGCPNGPPCTITPEQAAYNALDFFFYGTLAAAARLTPLAAVTLGGGTGSFGGTSSGVQLNYLQIYYEDVQYAGANKLNFQPVSQYTFTTGTWPSSLPVCPASDCFSISAQSLLETANQQLFLMAEAEPVCPPGTSCPGW